MDTKIPCIPDNAQAPVATDPHPNLSLVSAISPTGQYRIAWQKKIDGPGLGKGTKTFTLDQAVDVAIELNTDYPKIHHWVIPA